MKFRFLRLGRSNCREGESTIPVDEGLAPKDTSSAPMVARITTGSDTRDESRDSAKADRSGDDHEQDEPLVRVGNEGKNKDFHQNTNGSLPVEDNIMTPSFIASVMKELASPDLDSGYPPTLQRSAKKVQETTGLFESMMCLPTFGRRKDTKVVIPFFATDEADTVNENKWRATIVASEGDKPSTMTSVPGHDEVHRWHFFECFGEYHDESPEEEEKKNEEDDEEADNGELSQDDFLDEPSASTSTSLLVARLIDADHDCERSLVHRIVEGSDEAMLVIAPDLVVGNLEGRAKKHFVRMRKFREANGDDAGKKSILWNSIGDANIVLNGQEKTCCEHCRQPFSLGETRVIDHYCTAALNMKGIFHPTCRLIRREVLKHKKQVLRQISVFGLLKRKRILENQRALRKALRHKNEEEKHHGRNKSSSKLFHESQSQTRTPVHRGRSRTKSPSKKMTDRDVRRSPIRSERQKQKGPGVSSHRLSVSPRRVQKGSRTRSPKRIRRGYWKPSPSREPSRIREDDKSSRRVSQHYRRPIKNGKQQDDGSVPHQRPTSKSRQSVSEKESSSKRFSNKTKWNENSTQHSQYQRRRLSRYCRHESINCSCESDYDPGFKIRKSKRC